MDIIYLLYPVTFFTGLAILNRLQLCSHFAVLEIDTMQLTVCKSKRSLRWKAYAIAVVITEINPIVKTAAVI